MNFRGWTNDVESNAKFCGDPSWAGTVDYSCHEIDSQKRLEEALGSPCV